MKAVRLRILLLALAVTGAAELFASDPPAEPRRRPAPAAGPAKPLLGSSPEEVKDRLGGPPARVSRQVYQLRCEEQWHYGAPHHLRVTFDCPRGQKPRVTRVRSLADR
jgi:hypothetical protein